MQFDRATANVYKSNAFIQFDKVIYLDRYVEDNFEQLRDRRTEVANWRTELEKSKKEVDKYKQFKVNKYIQIYRHKNRSKVNMII